MRRLRIITRVSGATGKCHSMFKYRLISSVGLIGLISVLVYYRLSSPTFALVSLVAILALWEFYRLQESKGLRMFKKAGVFGALMFFLIDYFKLVKPHFFGHLDHVEAFAILLVILGILGRMVFEKERVTPVDTISLTLFGFFYVPYLFNYISKIIFPGRAGRNDRYFFGGIFDLCY